MLLKRYIRWYYAIRAEHGMSACRSADTSHPMRTHATANGAKMDRGGRMANDGGQMPNDGGRIPLRDIGHPSDAVLSRGGDNTLLSHPLSVRVVV